jgi:DNA polymerase-4
MLLQQALKLEHRLIVIDSNPELYQRAMNAITKQASHYSPYVEPIRYGQIAIDMTGTTRLLGKIKDSAYQLYKELYDHFRLTSSIGISVNKLVASVAARYIGHYAELFDVLKGSERTFLEPLELKMLPGVGHGQEQALLEELNIQTIGMLAAVPIEKLIMALGQYALGLHQKALGIDHSPVLPPERHFEIKEEYTLNEDTNDDHLILGIIYYLIEKGCGRLRQNSKKSSSIRIFCRYSDSKVATRTIRFPEATHREYIMYYQAQKIFEQLFERRTRVRYLSVAFENLTQSAEQTSLFSRSIQPAAEKHRDLHMAMDKLRGKHGYRVVRFGLTQSVILETK